MVHASTDQTTSSLDQRRADRKRRFEQIIMLPVSVGMLAATVGYTLHDIIFRLGAKSLSAALFGTAVAMVSIGVALLAFVYEGYKWLFRR